MFCLCSRGTQESSPTNPTRITTLVSEHGLPVLSLTRSARWPYTAPLGLRSETGRAQAFSPDQSACIALRPEVGAIFADFEHASHSPPLWDSGPTPTLFPLHAPCTALRPHGAR